MMLPRYSLRWILGATACCAVAFTVASFAAQGHAWAAGLIAPVLAAALLFLLFVLAFCAAFVLGSMLRAARGGERAASPFQPLTTSPPAAPLAAATLVDEAHGGPESPFGKEPST